MVGDLRGSVLLHVSCCMHCSHFHLKENVFRGNILTFIIAICNGFICPFFLFMLICDGFGGLQNSLECLFLAAWMFL